MNLYQRLRAAADHIATPDCDLDVRRGLRDLERRYQSALTARSGPERVDIDIEVDAALERAYLAGIAARDDGDMHEAAHQLLVAADHQVGDAPLLLAEILVELGDHDGALRWCDVAERDGFDEAAAVAARCRERMAATAPRTIATGRQLPGPPRLTDHDDAVKRQRFLAHAQAITMGATAIDSCWEMTAANVGPDWHGRRIGVTDVRQTEAATRALRSLDYQYGGANTRSAVLAQVRWAEPMLAAGCDDAVRKRLRIAVADLHNLAGWVSYDVGLVDSARSHLTRAMDLLSHTGDHVLLTRVLWHAGRMYLHNGVADEAKKYFQLCEVTAARTGDSTLVALGIGGQAWAASLSNNEREALCLVNRTRQLTEQRPAQSSRTHIRTETLYTTIGSTYAVLARRTDKHHAPTAIQMLTRALDTGVADRPRCLTSLYATLAGTHLAYGDIPTAGFTGTQALDAADNIQSHSLDEEFRELKDDADRHAHPTARLLADRITERLLRHAC